jgi:hypothetical protein
MKAEWLPDGWMALVGEQYVARPWLWCARHVDGGLCIRQYDHEGEHWFVKEEDVDEFYTLAFKRRHLRGQR